MHTMSQHEHTTSAPAEGRRETKLLWAAVLTTVTMVAEAVGGIVSGSLALLADAGHMLVDSSALILAWLAARFARRPSDARRSFGYGRLEVLAGFVNALTMFVLVGWIVWEAIERIREPSPILSGVMLLVALGGLAVNLIVLTVLGGHGHAGHDHGHGHDHGEAGDHGHDHDRAHGDDHAHSHAQPAPRSGSDDKGGLNVQAARLHVIGDLLGSVAAVVAALVVHFTGWTVADPILSVLVAMLILAGSWRLLRRSAHILLEGVPEGLDPQEVLAVLSRAHPDIRDVHHLHLWALADGERIATLHLRMDPRGDISTAQRRVRDRLAADFAIGHATIQVELDECADRDCGDGHGDVIHDQGVAGGELSSAGR